MNTSSKNSAGFSLMEAIIVIALVSVILVMLSQFFLGGNQTYRLQKAEISVNYSARAGLDDIDSYVRQAAQVLNSYDVYTAGSAVLILEIPSLSASNQIIPATNDHVVYYMDGTKLLRQIYVDPASIRLAGTKLVAENISSIEFILDNVDYAQVTEVETEMVITENTGRENKTLSITSKSRLRN